MLYKQDRRGGFTLIELLVASVILVVCVTAALRLYLDVSFLVSQSKARVIAATHLKSIFEYLDSLSDVNDTVVTTTNWTNWLENGLGSDLLDNEAIIASSGPLVEDYKPREVTITATWDHRGRPNTMSFTGGFL